MLSDNQISSQPHRCRRHIHYKGKEVLKSEEELITQESYFVINAYEHRIITLCCVTENEDAVYCLMYKVFVASNLDNTRSSLLT